MVQRRKRQSNLENNSCLFSRRRSRLPLLLLSHLASSSGRPPPDSTLCQRLSSSATQKVFLNSIEESPKFSASHSKSYNAAPNCFPTIEGENLGLWEPMTRGQGIRSTGPVRCWQLTWAYLLPPLQAPSPNKTERESQGYAFQMWGAVWEKMLHIRINNTTQRRLFWV